MNPDGVTQKLQHIAGAFFIKTIVMKGVEIIYEDQWLLVARKDSGMLCVATDRSRSRKGQPSPEKRELTAYSQLMSLVQKRDPENRIFIVHRLDRDTSGILVFAKDEETKRMLQDNWEEAVIERKYVAVTEGAPAEDEGMVVTWQYENPKSLKVHNIALEGALPEDGSEPKAPRKEAKLAKTKFKVIKYNNYALMEFELLTGRKNQIRSHSQWLGFPIAGDRKYGAQSNPINRLALHAKTLVFRHPHTGKVMRFKTEAPKSFRRLIAMQK